MSMPFTRAHAARLLASAAVAAVLAAPVGGCTTTGDSITGSLGSTEQPRTDADWRRYAAAWGERYRNNTADAEAAMNYAHALRATGERAQAAAVLEQASIQNPSNKALLGEYGRSLADIGSYNQALEVLARAHTPDQPDWRILNAQGAVLDQMGRHQEAQRYYSSALKIIPNEPSVLSNLGLSYALSKDLKSAEITLRRAVAQPNVKPKVRQNLALVVGLQGRFAEAEKIAGADLPPDEAAANVSYLRQMLAEQSQAKKYGKARVPAPDTGS
ncbi:MAG: tetratricopeptide repeat protein [Pseudolabrys sp.]